MRLFALACVAVALGCASTPATVGPGGPPGCVPGAVTACPGGTQTCQADGTYGACELASDAPVGVVREASADVVETGAPDVGPDEQKAACLSGAPRLSWQSDASVCIDSGAPFSPPAGFSGTSTPIPCVFQPATDGALRCLPQVVLVPDAYSDATCDGIGLYSKPTTVAPIGMPVCIANAAGICVPGYLSVSPPPLGGWSELSATGCSGPESGAYFCMSDPSWGSSRPCQATIPVPDVTKFVVAR